ncbi:MAG TPA: SufS family cysteine desulfurase [Gemmatimonadaceae bacterium]|jgi:cysteine desulfurase/selenocysteine lyase|nr:SufS family cysteine desulfurase [Gemmatimonadaceae bacterium]
MTWRSDFPLLATNPSLHYLDSAASSQKPGVVLDALRDYYTTSYANPHRGAYDLSVQATVRYHEAREKVARFFGVKDAETLVFTRGTTEALNLVATAWGRTFVHSEDEIVITAMEHHANFVPWQQLALAAGAVLRICELTGPERLDLDMLRSMVNKKTKIVAFTHVSNALGTVNPVREIAAIVRERSDALIVCDGAQSAPHLRIDFDTLGVDCYAFSGHKMCGPMGIGGLIAQRAVLEAMPPYQYGGDMIEFVYDDRTTWNTLPHKFEAGTPNAADAYALGAAVDYLTSIGMDHVLSHERALVAEAYTQLSQIEGIHIYGPPPAERSGVISFTIDDVHPHDLATILDGNQVCIRAGHHCTQPLMRRLGVAATARASFYIYNDVTDIEALVSGVHHAVAMFARHP